MIQQYQQDIYDHKIRLKVMEASEVQRLADGQAQAEELFNNHGKKKGYFQTPNMSSKNRSSSRRRDQTTENNNQLLELNEAKERERKRSASRNSKFCLSKDHEQLKKLIQQREAELNIILKDHHTIQSEEGAKFQTNVNMTAPLDKDEDATGHSNFNCLSGKKVRGGENDQTEFFAQRKNRVAASPSSNRALGSYKKGSYLEKVSNSSSKSGSKNLS